ncbi:MICAL C-terminal isoform B [Micractinium conductrix]|uniref:MICAL C-terminal isoform B n=1 Tax=Micractinium conductrix TaxID=554055 RepID=A0A2P6VPK5_9CHLO|nr:MICAL C-terminal isoform B [Micractinium conductrix]|eukprot:PSC75985.1 MICAL C-terminal isoform B [Micractinium conductrix]
MDAQALAAFEARASQAEQRLAALEAKLGGAAASAGGVDASRYVAELQTLREVLVAAKAEQEGLEKRVADLEQENSKLRYQCLHLKRAVTEGDEKLAALQKQ